MYENSHSITILIPEIQYTLKILHSKHQGDKSDLPSTQSTLRVRSHSDTAKHKGSCICSLLFNAPLHFLFFLVPLPPITSLFSSAFGELWITHYTFITDRLCMSTFICIALITTAMFIHETPSWAPPTSLSDGHADPKCPWCVAAIRLLRQLINRATHQSFVDGRRGLLDIYKAHANPACVHADR